MTKIKSQVQFKFKWFIAIFFMMGMVVYAQDSTRVIYPPSSSNPSSTSEPSSTSNPSSSSSSSNTPASQDLSFNTQAMQLSNELIKQTGLSTDKADKISQILVDYRNNVAKARADYYEDHPNSVNNTNNSSGNTDVTGGQSNVDMNGILGDNVDKYYSNTPSDLMKDYKKADSKTDDKIKDVFDNDVQRSRYEQTKSKWWSDVKDKVFSSLSENSGTK